MCSCACIPILAMHADILPHHADDIKVLQMCSCNHKCVPVHVFPYWRWMRTFSRIMPTISRSYKCVPVIINVFLCMYSHTGDECGYYHADDIKVLQMCSCNHTCVPMHVFPYWRWMRIFSCRRYQGRAVYCSFFVEIDFVYLWRGYVLHDELLWMRSYGCSYKCVPVNVLL